MHDGNEAHPAEAAVRGSVLIVDDNAAMVLLLEHILTSDGYQVFSATSAQAALGLLETQAVDIILSDVVMPQMDGYGFQASVRENAALSKIPFIFLTALDDKEDICKAKSAGADDYLIKPPDPFELLAAVRGRIARAKQQQQFSHTQFDEYRRRIINTVSHEFRTPMVSIRGATEILISLSKAGDHSKTEAMLEIILHGVERMDNLVENFIQIQRINARLANNQYAGPHQTCHLGMVASLALERYRDDLKCAAFPFSLEDNSGGAAIHGAEEEIVAIVEQFISNSIKFSKNEREIVVVSSVREQNGVIEVLDRGVGFDPEKLSEALEAFGQIDRKKEEQQGGGLGLAIASGLAALNLGSISVEKRDNGGTIARLVMPLASALTLS